MTLFFVMHVSGDTDLQSMLGNMSQQQLMQLLGKVLLHHLETLSDYFTLIQLLKIILFDAKLMFFLCKMFKIPWLESPYGQYM